MSRLQIVELTFLVTLFGVTLCWRYGLRHDNDLSVIDGYYGFASLVHGALTYLLWPERTVRGLLVTALCGLWAVGLGQSLFRRWFAHRNAGGDERYRQAAATLKLTDGVRPRKGFRWKSYLTLVFPQAVLMAVLNLPVQLAVMTPGSMRVLDWLGLAVLATGGTIEVVANLQLERFKKAGPTPGSTLMDGLWAWSRHPNYCGNFTVYVGAYLVALSDPNWWWTMVSPLAILLVLRWGFLGTGVSGIDKLMMQKRAGNPDYLAYVERTPAFFLRPPAVGRLIKSKASEGPAPSRRSALP